MNTPDDSLANSTLHEFMDAEIAVDGIGGPGDEQVLRAALNGLPGIRTLTIAEGKVSVEYDPVDMTKARLGEVIAGAGYRVADVQSGPASAISDALHHEMP